MICVLYLINNLKNDFKVTKYPAVLSNEPKRDYLMIFILTYDMYMPILIRKIFIYAHTSINCSFLHSSKPAEGHAIQ